MKNFEAFVHLFKGLDASMMSILDEMDEEDIKDLKAEVQRVLDDEKSDFDQDFTAWVLESYIENFFNEDSKDKLSVSLDDFGVDMGVDP